MRKSEVKCEVKFRKTNKGFFSKILCLPRFQPHLKCFWPNVSLLVFVEYLCFFINRFVQQTIDEFLTIKKASKTSLFSVH